jgi:hypothetical protein
MSVEIEVVVAGPPGPKGTTGNTGPTGPQGATGAPGAPGSTGAQGDKGDKGDTGTKGDKGDTGDKGDKGDTGDKGDPSGVFIAEEPPSDPRVPPTGAPYMWVDSDADANFLKGDKGDKGDTGDTGATPALTIGTVGTGAAAATLTGTDEEPVLNLTIPPAANDSITSAMIAADAVGTSEIAANAVGSSELADNAVDTTAIATGAVTAPKILIGAATVASGTGVPNGVLSAAPGSSWLQVGDAVTVSGNLLWRKTSGTGNTGWVPEGALADTGWRKIVYTSGDANWTEGDIYVRRVGTVVHVSLIDVKMAAISTKIITLPAGFVNQVNAAVTAVVRESAVTGNPYWFTISSGQVCRYGYALTGTFQNTYKFNGTFSYTTPDAWPSSLPGEAL